MQFYEPKSFKNDYENCLKMIVNLKNIPIHVDPVYVDLDNTRTKSVSRLYNDLTKFLSKREKAKDDKYSFLPPSTAEKTEKAEKDNELIDEKKITVVHDNKALFRLTSDQFGFSAKETIYFANNVAKYPLANLLFLYRDKSEEKQTEIIKYISEYVKNTRTLGGCFLWPIPPKKKGSRLCIYNTIRGTGGYLEDRVDLTLLEVKHALDGKYDKEYPQYETDKLRNQYLKNQYMKMWLQHFDSFEEYVRFFMLESFVDKDQGYMPLNIINGKTLDENEVLQYRKEYRKRKGELQKLKDPDKIKCILSRLADKIMERTKKMEKILSKDD